MTHISKDIAREIAISIVKPKFQTKIGVAKEAIYSHSNAVLDSLIDLKLIESAPEGYFPQAFQVYATRNWSQKFDFGKSRRIPHKFFGAGGNFGLSWDSLEATHLNDLLLNLENLQKDEDNEISELSAAIFVFKTFKNLIAKWPEIAPSVPEKYKAPKQALVVQTAALNQRFGLPIEITGAA